MTKKEKTESAVESAGAEPQIKTSIKGVGKASKYVISRPSDVPTMHPFIANIEVGKPDKQKFLRTFPGMVAEMLIIQYGEDRELYRVSPDLEAELQTEAKRTKLYLAQYQNGAVALITVASIPSHQDRYSPTLEQNLIKAQKTPLRIYTEHKIYVGKPAAGEIVFPPLPEDMTIIDDYLDIAFDDEHSIDSLQHDVVKALFGKV